MEEKMFQLTFGIWLIAIWLVVVALVSQNPLAILLAVIASFLAGQASAEGHHQHIDEHLHR